MCPLSIYESTPLSLSHLVGLFHQLGALIYLLANCNLDFFSVLFARFCSWCLVWWPATQIYYMYLLSVLLSPCLPKYMYMLSVLVTPVIENLALCGCQFVSLFYHQPISFSRSFYYPICVMFISLIYTCFYLQLSVWYHIMFYVHIMFYMHVQFVRSLYLNTLICQIFLFYTHFR